VEVNLQVARVPTATLWLEVSSFNILRYDSFDVFIKDCSVNVISKAGENLGPINREIPKNYGLQPLFASTEVATWFSVSDARPECGITGYLLYHTEVDPLT
jgi:hypothetical protein